MRGGVQDIQRSSVLPRQIARLGAAPLAIPDPKGPGPQWQRHVPHGFEWNRYVLPIASLPPQLEGLRILQITDLHFRPFWSEVYDELIARVRREAVDLIFITGDLNNKKRNCLPAVPYIRRFVSGLTARLGCFGILGNHDRWALAGHLENCGITLLDGKRRHIEIEGASLELIGLPGVHRKEVTRKILESFPPRDPEIPRLILSHFPDILRKAAGLHPDIYFAGHTHGGQVCLPGGVPIIRHAALPRRLGSGVHSAFDTWLVISRGLGFTGISLRLFCPAEVIEIQLARG
jgi:predicted MPP superfamily phosphohydrolase